MARTKFARYAAFHEAGHAVAETVLFGGITDAKVFKDGKGWRGYSRPLEHDNASQRDLSVVCLAGPVAHAKYQRVPLIAVLIAGGRDDHLKLKEACAYVAECNPDGIEREFGGNMEAFERDWFQQARAHALRLVEVNWAWITRVADHLAEHGEITGKQVKRLQAA